MPHGPQACIARERLQELMHESAHVTPEHVQTSAALTLVLQAQTPSPLTNTGALAAFDLQKTRSSEGASGELFDPNTSRGAVSA